MSERTLVTQFEEVVDEILAANGSTGQQNFLPCYLSPGVKYMVEKPLDIVTADFNTAIVMRQQITKNEARDQVVQRSVSFGQSICVQTVEGADDMHRTFAHGLDAISVSESRITTIRTLEFDEQALVLGWMRTPHKQRHPLGMLMKLSDAEQVRIANAPRFRGQLDAASTMAPAYARVR